MPKKGSKHKDNLKAQEMKFVAAWAGNDTHAARKIGLKSPNKAGPRMAKIPRVAEAIRKKQDALARESGKILARRITITRNDIINRLDDISTQSESDSARVAALRELKDIFGLSAKHDRDTDFFAGWSREELDEFARTGRIPEKIAAGTGTGES